MRPWRSNTAGVDEEIVELGGPKDRNVGRMTCVGDCNKRIVQSQFIYVDRTGLGQE